MTSPHTPRPTDLVALVSFDGDVYENQAVTRDGLGGPQAAPHALGAALQQWLGIGRHVWVDIRGRQIQGIATAREMATREAWEIDTLVDASDDAGGEVIVGLLRQATDAASEAGVSRLVLRTHSDAPSLSAAIRSGFARALQEQLWLRPGAGSLPASTTDTEIHEASDADAFLEFQLYSRTLPSQSRQLLGMTFDEWSAIREQRWAGRNGREYIVTHDGRARGALAVGGGQFSLLTAPGDEAVAEALIARALSDLEGAERVLTLLPDCPATPSNVLRAAGFEPTESHVLLVLRMATPVPDHARNASLAAGTVVPSGG